MGDYFLSSAITAMQAYIQVVELGRKELFSLCCFSGHAMNPLTCCEDCGEKSLETTYFNG